MEFNVRDCDICGKCSAGCPVSFAMDLLPHQILRLLQLEEVEAVLKSEAIWLCTSCKTCLARCPQEIDLPRIINSLRRASRSFPLAKGQSARIYHDSFLRSVERYGRVYHVGVALAQKISGSGKQDASLAWLKFRRRKLKFRPSKVKEIAQLRKMFDRLGQKGGGRHG